MKTEDKKFEGAKKGTGGKKRFYGKREVTSDVCNDWKWYADDPNLLKDATNLSFNNAVGGYLADETYMYNSASGNTYNNITIPGVMTLPFIPTVGISTDFNSPINVAKAKLYTFVRHANSGHSNYDSPDLMQYVMAKTSADVIVWHLARVYACAFKYSQTNRYLPKALIDAMGIDADDIVAHLADFRAFINITAVKLNALFIPDLFGYYKRQTWLVTNVFVDSNSPKAQLYVPVPYNAWVYTETGTTDKIGNLFAEVFYNPVGGKLTYAQIVTKVNNLINPLVASEDINIMSGDMLKAYGEEHRVKLPTFPENYEMQFSYSEEVLEQIHNTTLVGELESSYVLSVTQDPNTGLLTFDPKINADNYCVTAQGNVVFSDANTRTPYLASRKRFDLITNDASPERIIVASRNTAMFKVLSGNPTQTPSELDSCGSELFLYADIYVNSSKLDSSGAIIDTSKGLSRYRLRYINAFELTQFESYYIPALNAFTKFDWAPMCYFFVCYVDTAAGTAKFGGLVDANDINNYTIIQRPNLAKLHELALLTELNLTSK